MRGTALLRLGLACHAICAWLALAAFTDLFVGTQPLLLLAIPLVAVALTVWAAPWVGLVFLTVTCLVQFVGQEPDRAYYAVAIAFAAVQALRWHLRGRVWNFRRLSRQGEAVINGLLPNGVTLQADALQSADVQGMRFRLFRDGELAAVLVAVGAGYLRSTERLEPIMSEHTEQVPRMIVPLEATREPRVMKTLLGQMGLLDD